MQTFKKSAKMLLIASLVFLFSKNNTYAQNWDAKQQQVWKDVVTYNDLFAKGKVNDFMNYFDPSYIGWSYDKENPTSKEETRKGVAGFFDAGNKVTEYKANPLDIRVDGDYAFVDYTITGTVTDKDGKSMPDNERWTDILMKKNGKWMLIGDQGGELAKLKIPEAPVATSENWNADQIEILNTEKSFDAAFQNGDVTKMKEFYAPSYIDFSYSSDKPGSKEEAVNFISKFFEAGNKISIQSFTPLSINVHKDFAFIDYIIAGTITDSKGNTHNDLERWTDILQKKNGEWVIAGDHGGAMPQKK